MSDYKIKEIFTLILGCCFILSNTATSFDSNNNIGIGNTISCETEFENLDPCGGIGGLSFYATDEVVDKGDPVYVAVTASQFNVATFSWSMGYNDAIIRLDSVKNRSPFTNSRTIPNFGDGALDVFENYNTVGFDPLPATLPAISDYPSGTNKLITMVWSTPNAQPFVKNDCDTLFFLCFTAIGNPGDKSPVTFFDKPTAIDVTDGVNTLLDDMAGFGEGSVLISGTTDASEKSNFDSKISITPNPFREKTTLEFSLKESSQTQISIFDLEGRKIYEQSDLRSAGAQSVQLNRELFPSTGIFYVKISTEESSKTKKLFLVR